MTKKEAFAIAENHLQAKLNNSFTNPKIFNQQDLLDKIKSGETFAELHNEVESRYTTVTSQLTLTMFQVLTKTYRSSIKKGFYEILKKY